MNQLTPNPGSTDDTARTLVLVCYLLGAVGMFTGALATVVALIIAYIKKDESGGSIYLSHYTWLIKTFWIGIIGSIVSFATFWLFGLGWLIYVGVFFWQLYRYVKGGLRFVERKAVV
ncbi:MAG: hypothetical protein QE278_11710 [Limnobacter sp.]|nr:hypothetical protein [Limnobacter sp.]